MNLNEAVLLGETHLKLYELREERGEVIAAEKDVQEMLTLLIINAKSKKLINEFSLDKKDGS